MIRTFKFLPILLLAAVSGLATAGGVKGSGYGEVPSGDTGYDENYPTRKFGYKPRQGVVESYENLPETTNSSYHSEGGTGIRGGENLAVVVDGHSRSVRRLGDRERATVGTNATTTPMFYMRKEDSSGGLSDLDPIERLTGESESVYPDHPDWPPYDPNRQISFAQADCNICCGGRSFYANGVCFKCEDPSDPPAKTYQCGS